MPNAYYTAWKELQKPVAGKNKIDAEMRAYTKRQTYCNEYAWAIPTDKVIDKIAKYSPLVELGAGTGYWAYLLCKAGADVVAYDINPPDKQPKNPWHDRISQTWYEVLKGKPPKLTRHPDRALLLCWPPYDTPMADQALQYYRGDTVIYIGEGTGGCTATDSFHTTLYNKWKQVDDFNIPQWSGLHDSCTIYRRVQ